MAHGGQDWIARTDILLQTLTELIVRQRYGKLHVLSINTLAPAGWDTIIDVSGKGIIYGGWIAFDNDGSYLRQTVDTGDAVTFSFTILNDYSLSPSALPFFYLLRYDAANSRYVVGLSGGVTFDSSYKLEWYIGLAYTTARGKIFYALV